MTLAEIMRTTYRGELAVMAGHYLHRAVREDSDGLLKGRDRLLEARRIEVAGEGPGEAQILADFGDMVEVRTPGGRREHRWVEREGAWIARETVVAATSLPVSDPRPDATLGELSLGRGQFAADAAAPLPCGFPPDARAAADRLHRLWNGRELSAVRTGRRPPREGGPGLSGTLSWLDLMTALPDATLLIQRGLVGERGVAILWRLHGHHLGPGLGSEPRGRRVRLIGSSLIADDLTSILDGAALQRQLTGPASGPAARA